jgi:predicted nucleotidyltransferase/DNA-binding transcriptional ArsR family regulator
MNEIERAVLPALLGGARAAVLSALLLHPAERLHVRELARVTGTSAGSLHRELRLLAELGLLRREEAGRQVFYRADTSHPVYEPLAAMLRADRSGPPAHAPGTAGARSRAKAGGTRPRRQANGAALPAVSPQRLAALCRRHHVRRLAVFGSAARGEAGAASDVDLLVEFEPGRAPSFWESPGIEQELSALFGNRPVDLVPPEALNNPYRRATMLRDLTVLYEAEAG